MDRWSISAAQLEASFARAVVLQREIERKERLLGRRIQVVARGLADLMQPGEMHHRRGIGLHAFPVDGALCLAAGYLEEERGDYRYRYAVLCGGEAAKRALNTADLNPATRTSRDRVVSRWPPTTTMSPSSTGSLSTSRT